jgi:transposase-like protein
VSRVQRSFSTDFKARAIQRIDAGESLAAVARKLGVARKLLYDWRAAYRALGIAGLNRKRGPQPGGRRGPPSAPGLASAVAASVPDGAPSSARPGAEQVQAKELAQAKGRIAELERALGRQQVDLDFFREALRLMDATPPSGIATKSTRSSKR